MWHDVIPMDELQGQILFSPNAPIILKKQDYHLTFLLRGHSLLSNAAAVAPCDIF